MSKQLKIMNEFLNDLRLLHAGKLACDEFRKKYLAKDSKVDYQVLPDLVGNLSHFLDDEDLRKKDPEYRQMQMAELLKLIGLIETGAPFAKLKEIHFLGPSGEK